MKNKSKIINFFKNKRNIFILVCCGLITFSIIIVIIVVSLSCNNKKNENYIQLTDNKIQKFKEIIDVSRTNNGDNTDTITFNDGTKDYTYELDTIQKIYFDFNETIDKIPNTFVYGNICEDMINLKYAYFHFNDTSTLSVSDNFCAFMFSGCYNLTQVDIVLPSKITNVGSYFCYQMFFDCEKLIDISQSFEIPEQIQAVGDSFCSMMFTNCYAIQKLPYALKIPYNIGTTSVDFCYSMFAQCTSLIELPQWFSFHSLNNTIENNFCKCMFEGCSSLKKLPNDFKFSSNIQTINNGFCEMMFKGCSSLNKLPAGFTLPITGTIGVNFCKEMFKDTGLKIEENPDESDILKFHSDTGTTTNNFALECFNGTEIVNHPNFGVDADGTVSFDSEIPIVRD